MNAYGSGVPSSPTIRMIPATFLTDQRGVIPARHLHPDFSRRGEPADTLAALRRIKPCIAA